MGVEREASAIVLLSRIKMIDQEDRMCLSRLNETRLLPLSLLLWFPHGIPRADSPKIDPRWAVTGNRIFGRNCNY